MAAEDDQSFYGTILENLAEGIIVVSARDGSIVYVNPALEHMFGYGAGELIGKNIALVNAPTEVTAEEKARAIMEALQKDGSWEGDILNIKKTGEKFWCHAKVAAYEHRKFGKVWISIHMDVDEQRRMERGLTQSEAMYRSLFENMKSGFAYCRMEYLDGLPSDFTYLIVNRAFSELTGLKDVAGKKFTEVLPGVKESNPEILTTYGMVAQGGEPASFESFSNKFGGWLSVVVYCPQKGYFVAVFDNITERRRTEEELKRRLNEADTLGQAAIGREIKMINLEKEVDDLLKELGRPPRYHR